MQFLVVLAVALVCANAAPQVKLDESQAPILRSSQDASPDGSNFQYGFETGNGIASQVEGVVKNPESDSPTLEIKGQVKYTAPDGTPVEYSYIANEGGVQVTGSHIPVSPPIPELILRGLQYIETHPAKPASSVVVQKY